MSALINRYEALAALGISSIPIMPNSKRPGALKNGVWRPMPGWSSYCRARATPEVLALWGGWSAQDENVGVGVACGRKRGVDLDILDLPLADAVEAEAFKILGPTKLVRIGRAPKRLLVYRTAEPASKLTSAEYLFNGQKCVVEILGDGQQFVAYGTHPDTGKPYIWRDDDLMATRFEDIPLVEEAALRKFIAAFESLAELLGAEKKTAALSPVTGESKSSEALDINGRVPEAMKVLENDDLYYDAWIRIGIALKRSMAHDPGLGLQLWHDFSAKSSKYAPELTEEKWDGFDADDRKHSVGAGTLIKAARDQEAKAVEMEFQPIEPGNPNLLSPASGRGVNASVVADLFTSRFEAFLRFDHSRNKWFRWDGSRWALSLKKEAFSYARILCKEVAQQHGLDFSRAAVAGDVERFAQSDEALAVDGSEWDRDIDLIGTPGGTVDTYEGSLMPSSPGDMITKSTSVVPTKCGDPKPDRWVKFISECAGGDADLINYLQKLAGYMLTGDVREHVLIFIYGPGGNGKSLFVNTLLDILGDYGHPMIGDLLAAKHNEPHPTHLAALRGSRLAVANETRAGKSYDDELIKRLTGGDPITARVMHGDPFTFKPTFKIVVVGNHEPKLDVVDEAMRRRFHVVPFCHKPPLVDYELADKLKAEAPAILRWMIDGCLLWRAEGLERPQCVRTATESYFDGQDYYGDWLKDSAIHGDKVPGGESRSALWTSWSAHAKHAGRSVGDQSSFYAYFKTLGLEPKKTRGVRGFAKIALFESFDFIGGN